MAEIKDNHKAENQPAPGRTGEDIEQSDEAIYTERGLERKSEDENYIPVIIKRSDETVRHPDDVLEKAIEEGLEQVERPFWSLLLSSIGAGLILGFTAMAVAIMATLALEINAPQFLRLSMAFVYPLGFIICIMSGTQLFTEHTATAVYPLFAKKISMKQLLRLWLVVISGNLFGALGSAGLLTLAEPVTMAREGYILIGHHLVHQDNLTLIVSSLLAGWLMALGGWLVLVTSPAFSQIVCIYIVTFLIGLGGLHHSIAGAVEMFTVLMVSNEYHIFQGLKFIGLALVGNLIGGSIFVAGFNYSHIRKTQQV